MRSTPPLLGFALAVVEVTNADCSPLYTPLVTALIALPLVALHASKSAPGSKPLFSDGRASKRADRMPT